MTGTRDGRGTVPPTRFARGGSRNCGTGSSRPEI